MTAGHLSHDDEDDSTSGTKGAWHDRILERELIMRGQENLSIQGSSQECKRPRI